MSMSVLFLFGAGASHGSENGTEHTPALGANLFQALRARAPLTWGKLDKKYGGLFRDDFEKAMDLVIAQHPLVISELERDMAEYFFNFWPSPHSLYIKLIQRLSDLIHDISFSSLNYDRLLEEAILRSGFSPNYIFETYNEKEVSICLPHGCCNLFLKDIDIPPGCVSFDYTSDQFDSDRISVIRTYDDFRNELQSRALPPIMACFNPKKTLAVGRKFLEIQKMRFEKMVQSAGLIVIVGVQVREHDDHIWSPLARTNAKLVYCSGTEGMGIFKAWSSKFRVEKNDRILESYFADHFEEICDTVEDFFAMPARAPTGSCNCV